jgi:hypothetical protein
VRKSQHLMLYSSSGSQGHTSQVMIPHALILSIHTSLMNLTSMSWRGADQTCILVLEAS